MVMIGLSKRWHLPVWKVSGATFKLWQLQRARSVEMTIRKSGLKLDGCGVNALVELHQMGRYYLPPFSLNGKTVLDIGAGCGETAWYFLRNGARKVVCIEQDKRRARLIEENRKNLNLSIEIIPHAFTAKHLSIPHDFIKCDIEGGEIELLPYAKKLKPCVLEVHSAWIKQQFEKNGFHAITKLHYYPKPSPIECICLMANFNKRESH